MEDRHVYVICYRVIPWQIRGIIKEIKHKNVNFGSFFINLVHKQANTCADGVVKATRGGSLENEWNETLERGLRKLLQKDKERA